MPTISEVNEQIEEIIELPPGEASTAIRKTARKILKHYAAVADNANEANAATIVKGLVLLTPYLSATSNEISDFSKQLDFNEEIGNLIDDVIGKAINRASKEFRQSIEVPGTLLQIWHKGQNGKNVEHEDLIKTARLLQVHAGESDTRLELKESIILSDAVASSLRELEKLKMSRDNFISLVTGENAFPVDSEIVKSTHGDLIKSLNDAGVPEHLWVATLLKLDDITIIDRENIYDASQYDWGNFPRDKIRQVQSAAMREVNGPYESQATASDIDRIVATKVLKGWYVDIDAEIRERLPKLYAPFGCLLLHENWTMAASNEPSPIFDDWLKKIADIYDFSKEMKVSKALINETKMIPLEQRSPLQKLICYSDMWQAIDDLEKAQKRRMAAVKPSPEEASAYQQNEFPLMSVLKRAHTLAKYSLINNVTANVALNEVISNKYGNVGPFIKKQLMGLDKLHGRYFAHITTFNWRRVKPGRRASVPNLSATAKIFDTTTKAFPAVLVEPAGICAQDKVRKPFRYSPDNLLKSAENSLLKGKERLDAPSLMFDSYTQNEFKALLERYKNRPFSTPPKVALNGHEVNGTVIGIRYDGSYIFENLGAGKAKIQIVSPQLMMGRTFKVGETIKSFKAGAVISEAVTPEVGQSRR